MNTPLQTQLYADARVIRVTAAQTATLVIAFLLSHWSILLWILLADFALRAFTYWPSPLVLVSRIIVNWVGLPALPIFAPPKKFAATLGFGFTALILVLWYTVPVEAATIAGVALITLAILESCFNVCAGCYIHSWIVAPVRNKIYQRRWAAGSRISE
ncbi:DUF4395 domain-containing protein [Edaphocola aurantiacus]|uniref:DUF4395 domain-containing protein n=1 Tax=Edaphocola aurantiacus TaxID=2601682 RepID=UPI001C98806D|nr:DUF4395 domain-containing protein [Edaphocola aurantiacus]